MRKSIIGHGPLEVQPEIVRGPGWRRRLHRLGHLSGENDELSASRPFLTSWSPRYLLAVLGYRQSDAGIVGQSAMARTRDRTRVSPRPIVVLRRRASEPMRA